ncbi:hypothetical protein Pint_15326 [Pistacia integerrima]|uniref:Uncharacterized protein n=1 Tax=Pistacia integerrima TaxID=434235 RepID=A0ACC0ZF06_9ROSI|nr:hypothetical protein Pint_15326 [Pistacia integerrima]
MKLYIDMVHFRLMLACLFVQFQWPLINPGHGSSTSYSNGFDNNCTLSSSQFHGELEDVWIAQRNFQDKYPDEATGQTLPADTDTDNTDAFVDGLFVDIPIDLN